MHQLGDVVTGVHATTFTFGPNGFRTSVGEDTNGDGTLESLESWTYDTFGRITSYRDESFPRPGFIGSISTFTYEHDNRRELTEVSYDGDGRILRRDVTSDLTGTGLVTTTVSELSSFDDIGNLLTFTVERYYIDEPLPSSRELETRSYGAGGEWLGSSWGVTYPNSPCFPLNPPCFSPNPHLPSSRRSVSVINQEFPDGVLLLAQEYLEN
jgi:YD repeat-containing protein